MSKVFISYKHVNPDQDLAFALENHLKEQSHDLFIDTQMLTGTKWVDEIEFQIRTSDFFVVLLSAESIRSHMVRQEVKLAHELSRQPEKAFTILPVRVAFEGELPVDLAAYLDPIQYAIWKEGEDGKTICEQISRAIEKFVALPQQGKSVDEFSHAGIQELARATDYAGAPLPAADPRLVLDTGTVKPHSPFYIRREADSELKEQVLSSGTTTRVKGMRQMGKSSLLIRAALAVEQHRQKALYLDFQLIAEPHLTNLESLLRYLAHKLARCFNASAKPEQYWDDYLGAKESITNFIEECILRESGLPVLILFDEADLIFKFPYRNDFFSTIRAWHNRRALKDIWNRLNIVIAHSTEPYLWIQDINQSPFNVGHEIKLDDFGSAQIRELNSKHGGVLKTEADLQELMKLVGGHPYLVRQSLYTLAADRWSVSQLQRVATDEAGPFSDHLRHYLWSLQKHKELNDVLRDVLSNGRCDDEESFQRLKAAGLVRGETRSSVRMRCQLYADYFKKHL